jgi:hypothetical protein
MVKFENSNSAEGVTLKVDNHSAHPIWYNNAEYTGSSSAYCGYAKRTTTYMYNGSHWVWLANSYDTNSTYTNQSLGNGYATCTTSAATLNKTASLSKFKLLTSGTVSVKFNNSVPANATLNVNKTGAIPMFFKG